MNIICIRDTFDANETLGKLQVGDTIYESMERPQDGDQPGAGCIPLAKYELVPHVSGHLHEDDGITPLQTWAHVNPSVGVFHSLSDVPAGYSGEYPVRTECLIHPANFASELEGCTAPGTARVQYGDIWEVINSRVAFNAIREALGGPGATGNTITYQDSA